MLQELQHWVGIAEANGYRSSLRCMAVTMRGRAAWDSFAAAGIDLRRLVAKSQTAWRPVSQLGQ
ncbi:MAG: hypothetical protein PsegKO_08390 [Pseudohongiellaceae bacterium]